MILRVLFLPEVSKKNPYQRKLFEGLEQNGVNCRAADYRGLFPILRMVRQQGPMDLVHLHWTHVFYRSPYRIIRALYALRFLLEIYLLKLSGVRLVWTIHNLQDHDGHSPHLDKFVNRTISRWCDRAIVHCDAARELAIAFFKPKEKMRKKLHVVPHGNYIGVYENTHGKEESRDRLDLDPANFIFLFLGHIRPYKGIKNLIQSFNKINEPSAHLIIAGNAEDPEASKEISEEVDRIPNAQWKKGFVPEEKIQLYMNASDVIVLPYEDILTSGSAVLAMSFGKSVIMPRIGCNQDMVGDEHGLIYEPEENGLRNAMMKSFELDLDKIGKANYQRVKKFDWSEISQETKKIYALALQDRSSHLNT